MTRRDILTTILGEVTGNPTAITACVATLPASPALDTELPPAEAQQLLTKLRAERVGILNWVLEGRRSGTKPAI